MGHKGDRVGFLLDGNTRRVVITRVTVVPDEPYTDAEIRKRFTLSKAPGGKTFGSAEAFLKHLHSLS